jgi:hypothetical protein
MEQVSAMSEIGESSEIPSGLHDLPIFDHLGVPAK